MQNDTLHLLPCKIDYVGAASVSNYFSTRRTEQGLQACFRGMPLNGSLLQLPSHKTVAMLDSTFNLQEKVDSVVVWNVEGSEARNIYSAEHYILSALWDDILQ